MPGTIFGYSPERAERKKNDLDADMRLIEYATHRMAARLPGAGAITAEAETFLERMGEMRDDLQAEVDRRTEGES